MSLRVGAGRQLTGCSFANGSVFVIVTNVSASAVGWNVLVEPYYIGMTVVLDGGGFSLSRPLNATKPTWLALAAYTASGRPAGWTNSMFALTWPRDSGRVTVFCDGRRWAQVVVDGEAGVYSTRAGEFTTVTERSAPTWLPCVAAAAGMAVVAAFAGCAGAASSAASSRLRLSSDKRWLGKQGTTWFLAAGAALLVAAVGTAPLAASSGLAIAVAGGGELAAGLVVSVAYSALLFGTTRGRRLLGRAAVVGGSAAGGGPSLAGVTLLLLFASGATASERPGTVCGGVAATTERAMMSDVVTLPDGRVNTTVVFATEWDLNVGECAVALFVGGCVAVCRDADTIAWRTEAVGYATDGAGSFVAAMRCQGAGCAPDVGGPGGLLAQSGMPTDGTWVRRSVADSPESHLGDRACLPGLPTDGRGYALAVDARCGVVAFVVPDCSGVEAACANAGGAWADCNTCLLTSAFWLAWVPEPVVSGRLFRAVAPYAMQSVRIIAEVDGAPAAGVSSAPNLYGPGARTLAAIPVRGGVAKVDGIGEYAGVGLPDGTVGVLVTAAGASYPVYLTPKGQPTSPNAGMWDSLVFTDETLSRWVSSFPHVVVDQGAPTTLGYKPPPLLDRLDFPGLSITSLNGTLQGAPDAGASGAAKLRLAASFSTVTGVPTRAALQTLTASCGTAFVGADAGTSCNIVVSTAGTATAEISVASDPPGCADCATLTVATRATPTGYTARCVISARCTTIRFCATSLDARCVAAEVAYADAPPQYLRPFEPNKMDASFRASDASGSVIVAAIIGACGVALIVVSAACCYCGVPCRLLRCARGHSARHFGPDRSRLLTADEYRDVRVVEGGGIAVLTAPGRPMQVFRPDPPTVAQTRAMVPPGVRRQVAVNGELYWSDTAAPVTAADDARQLAADLARSGPAARVDPPAVRSAGSSPAPAADGVASPRTALRLGPGSPARARARPLPALSAALAQEAATDAERQPP